MIRMRASIHRLSGTFLLPALVLLVSACSPGASASPSPVAAPEGSGGAPSASASVGGLQEMTPITVYVGGATSSAPQTYAADAEGIFEKHNLDAEFVVLDGTSQAVQAVMAHSGGFAFTDGSILDEMLIADNNPEAPALLSIAEMAPLNPVAVVFLDGSGIAEPTDLAGKTIGVPTGSLSETYLKVFLANAGVSESEVTIQNIGFSALHPALLQGQVDAV